MMSLTSYGKFPPVKLPTLWLRACCVLVLLAQGVGAQELAASAPRIMSFEEYARLSFHSQPYVLELHVGRGALLYFGARHIHDPAHAQVAEMERLWREFRPTVAYFEGGDPENQNPPPRAGSREEAVSRYGESGLTNFMAARDSIPARTLEPARREEIALLLREYTPEQVKLFYVLRQIPQFRDSRQEQSIESYVENDLGGHTLRPGLEGAPRTLAEFAASFARLFPQLKDWRETPQRWFDPAPPVPETYLNTVSRKLSELRDRHMVALLVEEVRRGGRVFAVVGSSHVVMQERALRDAFEAR